MNNPKQFKAKARPSIIKNLQQLANLLKNINKNVGKFYMTQQMTITGKWHGCHFKNSARRKIFPRMACVKIIEQAIHFEYCEKILTTTEKGFLFLYSEQPFSHSSILLLAQFFT